MKNKRVIFFISAALLTSYLTACTSGGTFGYESPETSVSAEKTEITAAPKTETAKTEPVKKEIKPLSPSRKQAYYEDGNFSVTVNPEQLRSSLYYPNIVHNFGANPDMFAITLSVKAKNMTEEERSFDVSLLSLSDMFCCGGDEDAFKNIQPGKSAAGELQFLCSLEQAKEMTAAYDGIPFEEGEDFYPEEFSDIIDTQSAGDVKEFLYKKYIIHSSNGYYRPPACEPCAVEFQLEQVKSGGKTYLAAIFEVYNRSDYAQLIDAAGYCFVAYSKGSDNGEYLYPLCISADEDLIYDPTEAEQIEGVRGTLYDVPEFVCMNPEGATRFTLVYDVTGYSTVELFEFNGGNKDLPYYNNIESIIRFKYDLK